MNMIPVTSSNLAEVGHDPDTNVLRVQFLGTGAKYDYANVSASKHGVMMAAESVGKYYNANIKNNPDHPCTNLAAAEVTKAAADITAEYDHTTAINSLEMLAGYAAEVAKMEKELAEYRAKFEPQAEAFCQRIMDATGVKHIDVDAGRFATRTTSASIKITDASAAELWAETTMPDAVTYSTVAKFDTAAIKKHIDENGPLPFVTATEASSSFSFKAAKKGGQ